MFAANGLPVCSYGVVILKLNLTCLIKFIWRFIIANVERQGANFLGNHGLIIDLQGQRIVDRTTLLKAPYSLTILTTSRISTINTTHKFPDMLRNLPKSLVQHHWTLSQMHL